MIFSVIVPTLNRPAALERCLRALSSMAYPKNEYEIIVVDDGGSLNIKKILADLTPGINLTVIRQPNGGPSSARSDGAEHAKGHFLAFTDDDCEPSALWLQSFEDALEKRPDALIGGRTVNGLPDNPYAATSQIILDFADRHFNADPNNGKFFESNNIAVSKALYQRVGFDPNFPSNTAEDRDFCDRWLAQGLGMVRAQNAIVSHCHEMGFSGFCRQHFNYGRGAWVYAAARRRRNRGAVQFEGWRFHVGLMLAPFRKVSLLKAAPLSALAILTQFVVAVGYSWERFISPSPPREALHVRDVVIESTNT